MKIPDEQMESSRRLEEYRLRTEPREIVRVDREDEPFQDDKPVGSIASGLIFGKPKMKKLIELQQQANEYHNLMHEQMVRSSSGIEQCPQCHEYYSRIGGHACPKTPRPARLL